MPWWLRWLRYPAVLVIWVIARTVYVAGRLFGSRELLLLTLAHAARSAFALGLSDVAERRARELLDVAHAAGPAHWAYGNAIHHANTIIGRAALARGRQEQAIASLLAAGKTPGSPQLGSFGPNMRLARDLLLVGRWEPVIEYLTLCQAFWKLNDGRLAQWADEVRKGQIPEFGSNLRV